MRGKCRQVDLNFCRDREPSPCWGPSGFNFQKPAPFDWDLIFDLPEDEGMFCLQTQPPLSICQPACPILRFLQQCAFSAPALTDPGLRLRVSRLPLGLGFRAKGAIRV